MERTYRIDTVGDSALSVCFGNEISPELNGRVHALRRAVEESGIPGITDLNPTYCSLLISYDPWVLSYGKLKKRIEKLIGTLRESAQNSSDIYLIPVCYGGKYGEDLEDVAAHAGITTDEVIRRHSAPDYLIYMLGFLPGFSYLGGLDPVINTPRLQVPRTVIPAGSVGIGGAQTGVYPLDSPGGWRLIGRTPVRPYDPRTEMIMYSAGDYIRFCPIDEAEYLRIEKEVQAGTYVCPIERRNV
ncbi:MAG: 5-oxoprolinase subunit PxpB [Clostridia bacterium]|nr:5-oxoprolinase subunit PxpB [Clostridia bacterium]MBR3195947.1 5-oxoprolinase subunit PxpB [Clostridia bacterium]